jgi:hypothetical protein
MMKITRPQTPKVLAENWEKWGKTYETGNLDFSWQIDKINVRNEILELLREMTTDHCSYCDGFPMESMLGDTVDHFKPKSIYPKEAYKWENLFLCCNICQKRINQYQDALLKPDEIEYEPNKLAGSANQERAKYTIKIFKLNEYNRPNSRKMFFRKFAKDTNPTVDEYPYRFILQ